MKKPKKNVIEVGESGEKDQMARTKQRDFEVHHVIAIQEETDEEFSKKTKKQDKFCLTSMKFFKYE